MKKQPFKLAVLTILITILLFLVSGCSEDRLTAGYVCNKSYEPAHLCGRALIPACWRVTLSVTSDSCSEIQSSDYDISEPNYDAVTVGEMVYADSNGALFAFPKAKGGK